MSSCSSNSSNLSGNVNIQNITGSGARLLMTIPLTGFSGGVISGKPGDDGITSGDAIRYDNDVASTSYQKYIKSQGDSPANSEVVGIIESVSTRDPADANSGVATVVLSGQIEYPEIKLQSATHIDSEAGITGSAGGNDVYFLSAATAGIIQNLAPTEPTQIVKPIYQISPDGNWTGQVVNYIGYQVGGQIVAEEIQDLPVGALAAVPEYGVGRSREGWFPFSSTTILNLNEKWGPTYGFSYHEGLGRVSKTTARIFTETAPSSTYQNQKISIRVKNLSRRVCFGVVLGVNAAEKYIDVEFGSEEYSNIPLYITDKNYFSLSNGTIIKISARPATYLSYRLPSTSPKTSFSNIFFKIDGKKDKSYKINWHVYIPRDMVQGKYDVPRKLAVSMPFEVSVGQLTAETLVAESASLKITNIANAINNMNNKIIELEDKIHGASSTPISEIEQK